MQFYRRYYESYFSGRRGQQLLQGLYAIWDQDYSIGTEIFTSFLGDSLTLEEESFIRIILTEILIEVDESAVLDAQANE